MTANEFYTCGYISAGVVALCSISFFVDTLNARQKKIVGAIVIVCLALGAYFNYKGKEIEKQDSKESETISNSRYNSTYKELQQANRSLVALGNNMREIKAALNAKHLDWDSTNKKITDFSSEFYMPNAKFNGNTTVGNGNNQTNHK